MATTIATSGREGSSKVDYEVGYVTDVEGNWQFFVNYLRISRVLQIDSKQNGIIDPSLTLIPVSYSHSYE
jgi:hypothetical protein